MAGADTDTFPWGGGITKFSLEIKSGRGHIWPFVPLPLYPPLYYIYARFIIFLPYYVYLYLYSKYWYLFISLTSTIYILNISTYYLSNSQFLPLFGSLFPSIFFSRSFLEHFAFFLSLCFLYFSLSFCFLLFFHSIFISLSFIIFLLGFFYLSLALSFVLSFFCHCLFSLMYIQSSLSII